MGSSIRKAIELILSADPELLNILSTTAKVCLTSSILALLIGVPLGILFGAEHFPGRRVLLVLNRTLIGMPPVVCGLLFYMLFSGVGPFRHLHWLFTVKLMILAQVVLITPIIIGVMETFVADTAPALRETTRGLGFGRLKEYRLLMNECLYSIFSAYLLSFARAIAEVGAVAMVGGAIAWKTNVMTTAIMMYTNQGDFKMAIALGVILIAMFLIMNIVVYCFQARVSR
jgi:tungstate transport system permease protein